MTYKGLVEKRDLLLKQAEETKDPMSKIRTTKEYIDSLLRSNWYTPEEQAVLVLHALCAEVNANGLRLEITDRLSNAINYLCVTYPDQIDLDS